MEQTAKSLRNARKGDPVQPEGMPPPRFNMPVDVRSMALSVLAVLAVIFTLRMAREVFLPVVISILFSYALNPVVNWLAAWKVPRWLSSAFLLTGLVVLLGLSFYSLADQTSEWQRRDPKSTESGD
ncbi:MAG: AI-2E family transporter [Nitrospirae bacterium]|nr:MAG: AI-2E family transporter [Nitrospirota bacterium]